MSDPVAPEVPTEAEILTGPEGFDIDQWKFAVAAGKYEGHEVEMAQHLTRHALAGKTRRWRLRWDRGEGGLVEVNEDTITLGEMNAAQKFSGIKWAFLNMTADLLTVEGDPEVAAAIVYGVAVGRLKMSEANARKAAEGLTAAEVAEMFSYYDAEPVGKADSDSEV